MTTLQKTVARVLKIGPSSVKDATSPVNVKRWDSFRGLVLITEIEKAFRVKFSMQEILSVKDVGSIKALLVKHGVDTDE
jgi:acyl carrier protein